MEELFYCTDRLEVYHFPDANIGLTRWNGFSLAEDYKIGMNKLIEFYTENKISKILADI